MSDQFVAEIRLFAGNFAPKGWAFCEGQLLPISQNTALFSLLGTNYGGDGKSTFALPNLLGSAPLGRGQGPGLSDYYVGQTGGSAAVTLLPSEMPAHSHTVMSSNTNGTEASPQGGLWANTQGPAGLAYDSAHPSMNSMHAMAMGVSGSSQPHNNMQPYLGLSFIIALQGIFPPRS